MEPASERQPARARALLRHAVLLSSTAFGVHLVWELVQCPIFFVHGTYDGTWVGMTVAALGDVGMTWLTYACVAAVARRWRWEQNAWRTRHWLTLVAAALTIGAIVEWRGLHEGRWWYTDAMPVVPLLGVGVVPLVQMLVLTPAVIAVAARLLDRRRSSTAR